MLKMKLHILNLHSTLIKYKDQLRVNTASTWNPRFTFHSD